MPRLAILHLSTREGLHQASQLSAHNCFLICYRMMRTKRTRAWNPLSHSPAPPSKHRMQLLFSSGPCATSSPVDSEAFRISDLTGRRRPLLVMPVRYTANKWIQDFPRCHKCDVTCHDYDCLLILRVMTTMV